MASDIVFEDGEVRVVDGNLIVEGTNGHQVEVNRDFGGVMAIVFRSDDRVLARLEGSSLRGVEFIRGAKRVATEHLSSDIVMVSKRLSSPGVDAQRVEVGSQPDPGTTEPVPVGVVIVKNTDAEPGVIIEGADLTALAESIVRVVGTQQSMVVGPRIAVKVHHIRPTGQHIDIPVPPIGGGVPFANGDDLVEHSPQAEELVDVDPEEIDLVQEVLRLRQEVRELKEEVGIE